MPYMTPCGAFDPPTHYIDVVFSTSVASLVPGREFLSDVPFSNLVSAPKFMKTNCACVSGWSSVVPMNPISSYTDYSHRAR